MLIHFGVIPYLVFDGDYLPSKSLTEIERASKREESRKLGLKLHHLGKTSQAYLELQKAVDVTPEMAKQLIDELKKINVQYLVAPYEADAQLAYLERKGIITGILSEDSDLLVFGARCLLTKLDQYGDCIEINRKDFTACREISLVGWTDAEFRLMTILSGCDYLTNIDKMGLKTAYRLVRKYRTIEKILQMLAFDGKYRVPIGYLESFRKAELTFLHQRVFCPVENDLVLTTSLGTQPEPDDFSFIGSSVDQKIAIGVSRGDLNPITKKPINVKSGIAETPKTPWSGSMPNSGSTFSDLKGNKSIQAFFKASRTPLAELDPNSFTPSPSQQRLLLQADRSWTPNSAPALPSLPQPIPSLSGSATPSTSRKIYDRAAESQSLQKALKRRRLCSETESENGFHEQTQEQIVDVDLGRSRYFANSVSEPIPCIKNKRSNKKEKTKEISIWSDDSVEDVMVGLPDLSGCHNQTERRSLEVFRDENQDTVNTSSSTRRKDERSAQEDSQSPPTSKVLKESNNTICSSAIAAENPVWVAKTIAENVSAELAGLSKKFSYQPTSTDNVLKPRNLSNHSQRDQNTNETAANPPQVWKGGMTALQRMGAGALKRSQIGSGPIYQASRLPTKAKVIVRNPEIRQIPSLLSGARVEVHTSKGSEDLIIPDSENDSESALSTFEAEAEEPKTPKLDLGRFAFPG